MSYNPVRELIQDSIQGQVRYLVEEKGMTIKDAIEELEHKWRGKLPDTLVEQINREEKFWRWND